MNICHETDRRTAGRHWKWLTLVALLATRQVGAATPFALAEASMHGDLSTMKALLKSGAKPDAPGPFGTPALHWRRKRRARQ